MKRRVLGALLLTLAACTSSPDEAIAPLPPPPTGEVTPPAKNVPAALAAFSGTWRGKWEPGPEAVLAVQTVARDGAVTGTYSAGEAPGTSGATSALFTGKVEGGTLALDALANGATANFAMQADGTLAGTYALGGQSSAGVFRK
jgi:hypothetical protein